MQMEKIEGGKFCWTTWTLCLAIPNGAGGVLYYWACNDYYVLSINSCTNCGAYGSCDGNKGVGMMPFY